MRVVALVLALTLVGACSSAGAANAAAPIDRASEELDILEAVFRHQFEHNCASYMSPDHFFISLVREKGSPEDPSAAFLARFKEHTPLVERWSAYEPDDKQHPVHPGRDKGKPVFLTLAAVRWIDDDIVEVDGRTYFVTLSASGNTYRAERRQGAWVVVSDALHWVS
jgi:hypothetical protein